MSEHTENSGSGALDADIQAVERIGSAYRKIKEQVSRVIVGQDKVVDHLLISLFARGHCLFVGVPGLAKTLLIHTLADVLDLRFNRIQFTPDLMPSDITGSEILQNDRDGGARHFSFIKGPVFCNILLADEINRAAPKTQAALLQSMQEYKVTASGKTYELERPFLVFATQNPIEQEGTYPLPEAQLDRFMFMIDVGYPDEDEERAIVRKTTSTYKAALDRLLSPTEILALQELVLRVPVADNVVNYAVALVRASRPDQSAAPDFVRQWLQWGAGPRASQYLILGAKARAVLQGRYTASIDDIRSLAVPVLQHRMVRNFHAEAEGVTSAAIVERLLETLPQPAV